MIVLRNTRNLCLDLPYYQTCDATSWTRPRSVAEIYERQVP